MKWILSFFVLMMIILISNPADLKEKKIGARVSFIGYGKNFETPYYIFESALPGPVVLLEAGIHGNEVAGFLALEELLPKIKIKTGKLIIFPRMNKPACDANKRYINKDLNSIFPGSEKGNGYEFPLAKEIFEMVGREKVEYVVTLHESRNLHTPANPRTFGQTIVYGVQPPPPYLSSWLDALNKSTTGKEKFRGHYFPIPTSSTEVFVNSYNLKGGFCVETWKEFALKRRLEMIRIVITTFLDTINFQYKIVE